MQRPLRHRDAIRSVAIAAVAVGGAAAWLAAAQSPGAGAARRGPPPSAPERPNDRRQGSAPREFYFTRAVYSGILNRFRGSWQVDYPKADIQFLIGLRRLTNIDAFEEDHAIALDDPELRRYPFLYAVEVGYMALSEAEAAGLRDYLLSGGFLVVDDFWGTSEWRNFETQIRRVLPEYPIVDLPREHPVLSAFFDVGEILQVPNIRNGIEGVITHERDGYVPALRGISDEEGRLMVVINWNTDLGDAWEWAENPYYPLRFSNFAYRLGVNFVVYAMSH